jgi:hypothetical protein
MNRYLDLLKRADQGGAGGGACVQERQMTNHQNLQNPVEGGSDGFVGRSDGTRAHSHPAASETPTDTAPHVRATRWLIHFLDCEPMEVHGSRLPPTMPRRWPRTGMLWRLNRWPEVTHVGGYARRLVRGTHGNGGAGLLDVCLGRHRS